MCACGSLRFSTVLVVLSILRFPANAEAFRLRKGPRREIVAEKAPEDLLFRESCSRLFRLGLLGDCRLDQDEHKQHETHCRVCHKLFAAKFKAEHDVNEVGEIRLDELADVLRGHADGYCDSRESRCYRIRDIVPCCTQNKRRNGANERCAGSRHEEVVREPHKGKTSCGKKNRNRDSPFLAQAIEWSEDESADKTEYRMGR